MVLIIMDYKKETTRINNLISDLKKEYHDMLTYLDTLQKFNILIKKIESAEKELKNIKVIKRKQDSNKQVMFQW